MLGILQVKSDQITLNFQLEYIPFETLGHNFVYR
jgi:hypothetical protein